MFECYCPQNDKSIKKLSHAGHSFIHLFNKFFGAPASCQPLYLMLEVETGRLGPWPQVAFTMGRGADTALGANKGLNLVGARGGLWTPPKVLQSPGSSLYSLMDRRRLCQGGSTSFGFWMMRRSLLAIEEVWRHRTPSQKSIYQK